jgi:hypothetical protein
MKRALLFMTMLTALAATGCQSIPHRGACNTCPPPGMLAGGGGHGGHGLREVIGKHGAGGYYGPRRPGHPDYIPKLPPHYAKRVQQGPPGPPAPSYVYPYYTTRGPRDFLVDNPPTIGR